MRQSSSILTQFTALFMLGVFVLFTGIQDAHHFIAHNNGDEEDVCTDRSSHHFHQAAAHGHCSICCMSSLTYPSPAISEAPVPLHAGAWVAKLADQTFFTCHFSLPYSLRAPPTVSGSPIIDIG